MKDWIDALARDLAQHLCDEDEVRDAILKHYPFKVGIDYAPVLTGGNVALCERCHLNPSRVCLGCATFAEDLQR